MRQGQQERLRVFCSQSFSRLFGDEVAAYKSMTQGVRAGGPAVIHCSIWVQSSLINPVHEMKHSEKCEGF